MTRPFANPITGANGELIRSQMKSPNFLTGVSGWIVRKDGSVEFNNAVIRGQLIVGSPPTTGLEVSAGIPAALVTYYSGLLAALSAFSIQKFAGDGASYFYEIAGQRTIGAPAYRAGSVDSVGNVLEYLRVTLDLAGAYTSVVEFPDTQNAAATSALEWVFGTDYAGTNVVNNRGLVFATDWFFGFNLSDKGKVEFWVNTLIRKILTVVSGATLALASGSVFTVDGVDQGRGVVFFERISGLAFTSTAVSGSEQVGYTTVNSCAFQPGRAYRIRLANIGVKSAVAQAPSIIVRKTNIAGTQLLNGRIAVPLTGFDLPEYRENVIVNNTAGVVTVGFVVTVTPSTATAVSLDTGAGTAGGYLEIRDIGAVGATTTTYSGPSV